MSALRSSTPLGLCAETVADCLDENRRGDALFARGWRSGLAGLTRRERCIVAPVTGHVAESVTAVLLDSHEWRVLWHQVQSGPHGVDLVFLTPDVKVVALEVKGTLVAGRIPRLSRHERAQLSTAWLDKADNPGMTSLGMTSVDVYGGVVAVNFPDLTWRMALTADFSNFSPLRTEEQLACLDWLVAAVSTQRVSV